MTKQELGKTIKTKYPQYSSFDDNTLADKVIAKYPQYASKINQPKTLAGFGENVIKSGANFVGDTVGAIANVFNPDMEQNTVANIGRLGAGTLQKLDPTENNQISNKIIKGGQFMLNPLKTIADNKPIDNYEPMANAVVDFYKNRYGSVDAIGDTLYNDPVGVLADVSTVVSGGAGLVRGGASALGKTSLASKASKVANVANKIDPIVGTGKVISKGTSKVFSRIKPEGIRRADDLVTAGIGSPAKQAAAEQKAGRTVTSFIDEYNLYDRSPETAKQVVKDIGEKFDSTAMQSGKQLRVGEIVKAFDDKINELRGGKNGVIADATRQQIQELQRRKQMFIDFVMSNDNQSSPLQVGLDDVTTFRRNVIDPDVPKSEFGLNPKDAGKAGGVKASRDILRAKSIEVAPELKKLGLDYGMAKELEKILKNSAARKNNRQIINFSRLGTAGVGGLISGVPGMIAGFTIEQIVNSPWFIKNASKGLKAALNAKVKTGKVGTFVRPAYDTGRAGRMADTEE